jgi:hypothetical protein
MIEIGQKLIRYIDGIKPTITHVISVSGRLALTHDFDALDGETLKPVNGTDRYEVASKRNLDRLKTYEVCYRASFMLMPMQHVRMPGMGPLKEWLS